MNTIHHLEKGLERETTIFAWHCTPVAVDAPIISSHALAAASISRLWREPIREPQSPAPVEAKMSSVPPLSNLQSLLHRRLSARQGGWDSWDKLSEL